MNNRVLVTNKILTKFFASNLPREAVKFSVVGLFGTCLNYVIFYISLTIVEFHYLISGVLGFIFPIPIVFLINRNWSFVSSVRVTSGLLKYFFVSLFALLSHSAVQYVYVECFTGPESLSQLVGIVFSASINFTLLKLFVFNK